MVLSVIDEAADKQIQTSIVVEVEPHRASGPVPVENRGSQAGLLADVRESAVPIVVIKNWPAVGGDEKVGIAVVVVVAYCGAHSESIRGDAGLFGNIAEGPV